MNRKLLESHAPDSVILVRFILALVFVGEGIQKFLFPDALGVGRFIKIGIPVPEFSAPFVGTVELICGLLILFGFYTRLAAIPLIIDMLVAISTTKIPMLVNEGVWKMLHESRVDFSMLFGSIFMLIVGAGAYSLDSLMLKKTKAAGTETQPATAGG